jgi:hypothetical protein
MSFYSLSFSTIPTEIGQLGRLEFLTVDEQIKLDSTIPTEFGLLTSLQVLHFNENPKLHGTIPTEFGQLSSSFKEFVLSETGITGTLPTELALLTSLTKIETHGSPITGSFPEGICQLPLLETVFVTCSNTQVTREQFEGCPSNCCYCY